ncbi:hypothetical protein LOZ66_006844 [Ophidiomyces ophidiicola]|nr:hypothetical protein LOZ66_006844 [Ophidiomyces ophidiicola]
MDIKREYQLIPSIIMAGTRRIAMAHTDLARIASGAAKMTVNIIAEWAPDFNLMIIPRYYVCFADSWHLAVLFRMGSSELIGHGLWKLQAGIYQLCHRYRLARFDCCPFIHYNGDDRSGLPSTLAAPPPSRLLIEERKDFVEVIQQRTLDLSEDEIYKRRCLSISLWVAMQGRKTDTQS